MWVSCCQWVPSACPVSVICFILDVDTYFVGVTHTEQVELFWSFHNFKTIQSLGHSMEAKDVGERTSLPRGAMKKELRALLHLLQCGRM